MRKQPIYGFIYRMGATRSDDNLITRITLLHCVTVVTQCNCNSPKSPPVTLASSCFSPHLETSFASLRRLMPLPILIPCPSNPTLAANSISAFPCESSWRLCSHLVQFTAAQPRRPPLYPEPPWASLSTRTTFTTGPYGSLTQPIPLQRMRIWPTSPGVSHDPFPYYYSSSLPPLNYAHHPHPFPSQSILCLRLP